VRNFAERTQWITSQRDTGWNPGDGLPELFDLTPDVCVADNHMLAACNEVPDPVEKVQELRVMCPQLAQIAVIADMISNSIVVPISVSQRFPGQLFDQRKSLKQRAGAGATSPEAPNRE